MRFAVDGAILFATVRAEPVEADLLQADRLVGDVDDRELPRPDRRRPGAVPGAATTTPDVAGVWIIFIDAPARQLPPAARTASAPNDSRQDSFGV